MAAEDIDHERDIHEAFPRGDVGEVGDPELIGPRRGELAIDQIRLADAASVVVTHAGRGPRRPCPSPPSGRPYSARRRRLRGRAAARPSAVRTPANSRPRPAGWRSAVVIGLARAGQLRRIHLRRGAENTSMGRSATPRRSAQPHSGPVVIHKLDHYFTRRSSAAWAKYATHSRVSTRLSRSSFRRWRSSPGRRAGPYAFGLAHPRVSGANLLAIDVSGPLRRMPRDGIAELKASAEYFLGLARETRYD